jgi:hypothetical protein
MIYVDHYGLHWLEGGIALLVQQDRVSHVLGVHMNFDVKVRTRRPCTHNIDLDSAVNDPILDEYRDDPLFQAMLPVPKRGPEKPLFLEDTDENRQRVQLLTALSSKASVHPFWIARPEVISQWLNETNVQPVVLFGPRIEHHRQLSRVLDAGTFSRRQLVVLGPRHTVTGGAAEHVTSRFRLDHDTDLAAAGAWALKQHMLGKGP